MPGDPGVQLPARRPFELRLYNTASRSVETFEPLRPGEARIYTCGPTVYAPQHVGNMRSQFFADLVRRTLAASGLEVTHVINITDVGHLTDDASEGQDKMEVAADRSGTTAHEIADRYTEQWRRDRSRLNCLEPTSLPQATAHIAEQIEMIRQIEAQGLTYRLDDGIYFDTARWPQYPEFARLHLERDTTTGRIENLADKRQPADFALWKFSAPGVKRQQEWDSPWGVGFPGWHIECSAMATKYLGERFDIHTGGVDHIKVHHTNEIAQSESALGVHPWVRYWLHHEFLNLGAVKMSKSEGTTITLDDLAETGIEPLDFRYFLLQAHYRSHQDLTPSALKAARTSYRRLKSLALAARGDDSEPDVTRAEPYRAQFWAAIADDLATPRALAVVWSVLRSTELSGADKWALLVDFDVVLGLSIESSVKDESEEDEIDSEVASLIEQRQAARMAKNYATADAIRDELLKRGIMIEDTPEGPRWHPVDDSIRT
jgi:cysteinyl-tRNA synthetase